MQGSHNSKRVSWASDANLCQVRLFLSEDSPSLVGLGGQDHLQVKKTLSSFHQNGLGGDDNLPPGFEGFNPANQLKNKVAQIPVVKWHCPSKFLLNVELEVVNGEQSREVEIQNQRESRVLEAIYPRQSAIPQNPTVSQDMGSSNDNDDCNLPSIPLTPIEEEDKLPDTSSVPAASGSDTMFNPLVLALVTSTLSQNISPNHDSARLGAGTLDNSQQSLLKAALTNVAKNNEQIDHDMLVKILSDPTFLQQFASLQKAGSSSQGQAPPPLYKIDPSPLPSTFQYNQVELPPMVSNGSLYPYPNGHGPPMMPHQQPMHGVVVPQVATQPQPGSLKDLSYYKNLIQQHGGERQSEPVPSFTMHPNPNSNPINHSGVNQDSRDNSKPREARTSKIMKPCLYFNTAKGCRHGANCAYQHDTSFQQRASSIPEMQSSKRYKVDREIKGSQSYT